MTALPGVIRAQLEGAHAFAMRVIRERFEVGDRFTDAFDEDDGQWRGNLGNRNYRLVHLLEAAYNAGMCAALVDNDSGDNEDRLSAEDIAWFVRMRERARDSA